VGLERLDVPAADEFAAPGGAYFFVLEFRRLRGSDEVDALTTADTFEGVDVDLEGTAR
jgi:hypothetical protein